MAEKGMRLCGLDRRARDCREYGSFNDQISERFRIIQTLYINCVESVFCIEKLRTLLGDLDVRKWKGGRDPCEPCWIFFDEQALNF